MKHSGALGALLAMAVGAPLLAGEAAGEFTLQSVLVAPSATLADAQVFNGFGCKGKNISPPLTWRGAPADSKSFALTVFDPDAPTGAGFWHWLVYDIPASVTELPLGAGNAGGAMPTGARQGRNDFGSAGYGGPCPPRGEPHRYVFTVYALKTASLELAPGVRGALLDASIKANELASASLTATYGR